MAGRREFEWDGAKAESNLAKHGVPFAYAARVFLDPRMVEFDARVMAIAKPDGRPSV
jgi:uncharacterized DUF497 family protein